MKSTDRILIWALLFLAVLAGCEGDATLPSDSPPGIAELTTALAPYTSFAQAVSAGYGAALTDCMSNGDVGAMGIHYGNPSLIDDEVDPLYPEVLIYEPGTGGAMSLVGVEFIIPFAIRPKTAGPPVLFGQSFLADDVFHLWALHVWIPRANPSGLFSPWNPRVHC
jgi:hypothetical protein